MRPRQYEKSLLQAHQLETSCQLPPIVRSYRCMWTVPGQTGRKLSLFFDTCIRLLTYEVRIFFDTWVWVDRIIRDIVVYVERQTGNKVKRPRSDNGGKYGSSALNEHLNLRGILFERMKPYTPQQNWID